MTKKYQEIHRPQFHFTASENWINDPNGLVYQNGIWHLFFQHNIEATTFGKMWWGHAVSHDLLHWQQVDHALNPDDMGSIFSGSAVVDHDNTANFGHDALLAFYTAAGMHADPIQPFTQCLAVSTDSGLTWTKHKDNPIIPHIEGDNRDPKVIWHQETRHWVMALYLGEDRYALLTSADAKTWTKTQELSLHGCSECPDFFSLVDPTGIERWVLSGANGSYYIGHFDGSTFSPDSELHFYEQGRNGYAAQTWSNAPDGRCVQISWMAGGLYPEMPFNQQMSIPVELSLVGSGCDLRLRRWPVQEVETLRQHRTIIKKQIIGNDQPLVTTHQAKIFDLTFTIHKQQAHAFYVTIRGHFVTFDWRNNTLSIETSAKAKVIPDRPQIQLPDQHQLSIRLLVDKTSIEVFINGGLISGSFCYLPSGYTHPVVMSSYTGDQLIENFELYELDSVWKNK